MKVKSIKIDTEDEAKVKTQKEKIKSMFTINEMTSLSERTSYDTSVRNSRNTRLNHLTKQNTVSFQRISYVDVLI